MLDSPFNEEILPDILALAVQFCSSCSTTQCQSSISCCPPNQHRERKRLLLPLTDPSELQLGF